MQNPPEPSNNDLKPERTRGHSVHTAFGNRHSQTSSRGSPEAPWSPSALLSAWGGPWSAHRALPAASPPHPASQAALEGTGYSVVLSRYSNPTAETETNLELDACVRKGERQAHS